MAHRSRIPTRRFAASVSDENRVATTATAVRAVKDAEPVKTVAKPRAAPVNAANKPVTRVGAAKVFGAPAVRPRTALGEIGNTKVQAVVSRLTKPSDATKRLPAKPLTKFGKSTTSAIARPATAGPRARLPAVSVRPTGIPTRASTLSARPISKPAANFGARRIRQPTGTAPPAATAVKRARSADPSIGVTSTTSLLGKHTRSGRVPRTVRTGVSSTAEDAVPPVTETATAAAAPPKSDKPKSAELTHSSQTSSETSSTAVSSRVPSLKLDSTDLSQTVGGLGELKFVEVDTIDYALEHTGNLNEQPILMTEINEFETDVDPMDLTLVPEFCDDIFGYMRELEVKLMPDANYIERQKALSWATRSILVEWIVQIHQRFNLLPETLYLCINFVDRFLAVRVINVNKLQLVGAVCLLLAAKYEEMYVPSVKDIEFMVENNYAEAEILSAERYILRILNFDLGWPGPLSFLRRISKADGYDMSTRTLAKYLIEVTLIDHRFIGVPSSKVAATAHYLALRFLGKGPWSRAHAFYAGYFESELIPLVVDLIELLLQPRKHRAIYEKYADRRFLCASKYTYQWLKVNQPELLVRPDGADRIPETNAQTNAENPEESVV
ncbi:B-type cyclin [Coemansia guatemalensis]|uniref:B-type cyclin n=1 Tax=Coemansia guatemalensis TaxID=2761395 RepID=A0A9W8I0W2_9FUNG|nr:B-type cyclin [Coemansia guatemalensis]